ncbi:MAG TPA: HAD-IIIC family phosphatase [Caulobacteraceae bacterium]
MRAFSVSETGSESLSLEPGTLGALLSTRRTVVARSLLNWDEHCSECAMPDCFASCSLYTPRRDFKCRRFDRGIETRLAKDGAGGSISLMALAFRRWGKLEAKGHARLVHNAERAEAISRSLQQTVDQPLLPINLRRKLGKAADLLVAHSASRSDASPELFLLEIVNPGQDRIELTLTFRNSEGKADDGFFQTRTDAAPGYNRFCVPAADIFRRVDEAASLLVQIEPVSTDKGTGPLLFGLADFVALADGASLAPIATATRAEGSERPKVKCVVWDLDNTLWRGVLVEDGAEQLQLDERIPAIIAELDRRGILNSIASKNSPEEAEAILGSLGLWDYFLHPQIHWNPKSQSLAAIAASLNIGRDTLVLIDDQAFERGEVAQAHPEVETFDVDVIDRILEHPRFDVVVTAESRNRRAMYRTEAVRRAGLDAAGGDYEVYLRSCDIRLLIEPLDEARLNRAFELTERTNQLNYSGRRLGRPDLERLLASPDHRVLTLSASDKYGDYGVIGVGLLNLESWTVECFFMSCRVQRKKVEHAFFQRLLLAGAQRGKARLAILYRPTAKNEPSRVVIEDEMKFAAGDNDDGTRTFWMPTDSLLPEWDIVTVDDRSGLTPAERQSVRA